MKKRMVMILLTMMMAASMVTACSGAGNDIAISDDISSEEENTEEEVENEADEEPVYKTVQYTVFLVSKEEEGFLAYDMDGQDYILTLSETLSEEEAALFLPNAALVVSTEVQPDINGSPEEKKATESVEVLVTAAELADELVAAELAIEVFKRVNGFGVEDMEPTSMYARQSVNVRKGPSTDYEQIGNLNASQEVSVTGIADTGWYRIDYDGKSGYVSNNYIVTQKPEPQKSAGSRGVASTVSNAETSNVDGMAAIEAARTAYKEAVARGDLESAMAIMNELSNMENSVSVAAGTPGISGAEAGVNSSNMEKSTSLSQGFVDYLNLRRAELGLSEMSWNDSLAATARERAEEIVDDFSHNGARNCAGEIILKTSSSDVATWYTSWYGSPGHRTSMLSSYNASAAAAYCKVGSMYYVVCLFGV